MLFAVFLVAAAPLTFSLDMQVAHAMYATCQNCGFDVHEDQQHCPNCGAKNGWHWEWYWEYHLDQWGYCHNYYVAGRLARSECEFEDGTLDCIETILDPVTGATIPQYCST